MAGLIDKPIDISLLKFWNSTTKKSDFVAVVATEKPEILWYSINESLDAVKTPNPCKK